MRRRKKNNIFKNKKVLIGLIAGGAVLLIGIIVGAILLLGKEDKKLKENDYIMYVKINPLVKLSFTESYYDCSGKVCSDIETEVNKVTLVNEDAKEIYKDDKFEGLTIEETVNKIIKKYMDSKDSDDKEKVNVEITTNFKDYKKYKLQDKIKTDNVKIKVSFEEKIDEDKILGKEDVKSYKVTFDSNGGSLINEQTVVENDKVLEPKKPTRDGYTFEYWKLGDKKYDFDTKVTSDIKLVAVWKEKEEEKEPEEEKKEEVVVKTFSVNGKEYELGKELTVIVNVKSSENLIHFSKLNVDVLRKGTSYDTPKLVDRKDYEGEFEILKADMNEITDEGYVGFRYSHEMGIRSRYDSTDLDKLIDFSEGINVIVMKLKFNDEGEYKIVVNYTGANDDEDNEIEPTVSLSIVESEM